MKKLVWTVLLVLAGSTPGRAQQAPLEVRAEDGGGLAVVGASVELRAAEGPGRFRTVTNEEGIATFDGLAPGDYRIAVSAAGFARQQESVSVPASDPVVVTLSIATFVQEVTVRAAMPELAVENEIEGRRLEEHVTQDVGEFLREQPELYSVRRGSINMGPVVRGLQEAQVAMFVDGTRTFSAGPGRMDSDMSHVSPHAVQSLKVVKGPYALTWGAGAMSAVQLETVRPNFRPGGFDAGGRAGYNYGGNGNTSDGYFTAWGSSDKLRFAASHNTRIGNDYEDGDGNEVPGDYKSFDTRWDLGFLVNPETTIEYSGGYQEQRDIDYPGRNLDATFFKTHSHAVELDWNRSGGGQLYGQLFMNLKEHLMNNDEKPSAMDMPGRRPPFGVDVDLPTESNTFGGRAFYAWGGGSLSYKAGLDFYDSNQNATRTISRRSNGMTLFEDIVWPDANIRDVGGYGQVIYSEGRAQLGGTVRVDGVAASAGETSVFFQENTEGDLDQNETNLSAALNATYQAGDRVVLSAGLGRAVRTANAQERYSDRVPSTQFQISAEFLGNPELAPERSLEWNVGASVLTGSATLGVDVFGRSIDDYITVMLDPDLPKRLPGSPDTVYRYVNGEARFFGYEAYGSSPIGRNFDLRGSLSYTWAEDQTFDEPAFGIPPLKFIVAGKVKTEDERYWGELSLTAAAEQTRVATARLEMPTDGWQRLDLRAGFALVEGLGLRLGITNLANQQYATHLNSLNPFARMRVAEPGRNLYVGIEYGF